MRTIPEIVAILQAHKPELALFGSYVHDRQHPDSDLDILVVLDDRSLSLLGFIALQNELSDLLQVKVDLVERETLKPAIGRRILADVVPV